MPEIRQMQVTLDNQAYTIDFSVDSFTDEAHIRVNGEPMEVEKKEVWMLDTVEYHFAIFWHDLYIAWNKATRQHDLIVKNAPLPANAQPLSDTEPMWVWFFSGACIFFAFVAGVAITSFENGSDIEFALTLVSGVFGMLACQKVARRRSQAIFARVILCTGITLLSLVFSSLVAYVFAVWI